MTRKENLASAEALAESSGAAFPATYGKSIVLIGLMGAGKSSVGKRIARRMGLAFVDADDEIVAAAGCSIMDIFDIYGEEAFRNVERQVIARLLQNPPHVLATGGGAFMNPMTRAAIRDKGISVWLRADLDTLVERTSRRSDRPLLKTSDPRARLDALIKERYPRYAEADVIVDTGPEPPEVTVQKVLRELAAAPWPNEPLIPHGKP